MFTLSRLQRPRVFQEAMPELLRSGIGFATQFAPTIATPNLNFAHHPHLAQISPVGLIPMGIAATGTRIMKHQDMAIMELRL
jgi:hypothetical protein